MLCFVCVVDLLMVILSSCCVCFSCLCLGLVKVELCSCLVFFLVILNVMV